MRQVSVVLVLFLLFFPSVLGVANFSQPVQQPAQTAQSDKILSARLVQELQDMQERIMRNITRNNDLNYQTLSQDNALFMQDMRKRIIIGVVGAGFVSVGLAGVVVIYLNKRNSIVALERKLKGIGEDKKEQKKVSDELGHLREDLVALRKQLGMPRQLPQMVQQSQQVPPGFPQYPSQFNQQFQYPPQQYPPQQYPSQQYPPQFPQQNQQMRR
jgi:hypothetical protein